MSVADLTFKAFGKKWIEHEREGHVGKVANDRACLGKLGAVEADAAVRNGAVALEPEKEHPPTCNDADETAGKSLVN